MGDKTYVIALFTGSDNFTEKCQLEEPNRPGQFAAMTYCRYYLTLNIVTPKKCIIYVYANLVKYCCGKMSGCKIIGLYNKRLFLDCGPDLFLFLTCTLLYIILFVLPILRQQYPILLFMIMTIMNENAALCILTKYLGVFDT